MLVNGQDEKLTLLYCSVLFKRQHCSCSETLLHERTHNLLPELISFVTVKPRYMDTRLIWMPHYLLPRTVCFVPGDPKKALAFYLNSARLTWTFSVASLLSVLTGKGSHSP